VKECHRLADQMRLAYDGDAWFGPSLSSLLDLVPIDRTFEHPIPGAHSPAELVAHAAFWKEVVQLRTEGDAVADANHRDWPPMAPGSPSWASLRQRLDTAQAALLARIEGLGDSRLDEPVPGQAISLYVMLHGVVQHDVYHAGQISMLLKAFVAT